MNAKVKTADPTDVVSNKTAVDTAAVQAQQTPAVAQLDKGSVKAPVPTTNAAGVPVAQAASPSDDDLGEFAGMGNENVTRDNMATPFLVMLQSNSPQAKRLEPSYVPGAEEGMFFNTVTKQLFDGQAGLECINCFFEELVTRWKPRAQGGGFRGLMDPNDPILKTLPRLTKPGVNGGQPRETMTLVMPDGTEVNNIHQHYLLARPWLPPGDAGNPIINPHPWEPMVLGLSSTQIKKSRNLNAQINLQRLTLSDGRVVPAPRFATVWRLTAVAESNADGKWVGVQFTPLRRVVRAELLEAKDFTLALASGRLRAVPTEETHPGDAGPRADGANGAHAGPTMEGRARPLGDADLGGDKEIPY